MPEALHVQNSEEKQNLKLNHVLKFKSHQPLSPRQGKEEWRKQKTKLEWKPLGTSCTTIFLAVYGQ